MKYSGSIVLLLAAPLAGLAQTAVFTDTFSDGSTINGTSTPGGIPSASSTSYDFASTKTGVESITANNLSMALSSATTSGFVEAQAVFTSSPVTLVTPGDYIDLTYSFTDTANLLAGGTSAGIMTGLYNSSGVAPVAGSLNSAGLSTATGSPYATGYTAGWQGYVGRIYGQGGTSSIYTRPAQTGTGTTSANQDILGSNFGSGAFNNPAGATIGGSSTATVNLTTGSQYTIDYRITLSAAGTLAISDNLYSGVGTGGTSLFSQSVNATGATLLTQTFDSLGILVRNSGTSYNPEMDINSIAITDDIQSVPEPTALALIGVGSLSFAWFRQRRNQA
jgi:hypothetical protein